jgi:hypothetical protein
LITFQRAIYGQADIVKPVLDPVTHQPVIDPITHQPLTDTTHLLPDASVWWYLRNLGIVLVAASALFLLAIKIFDKAEGNFAEVM